MKNRQGTADKKKEMGKPTNWITEFLKNYTESGTNNIENKKLRK